MKIKTKTRRVSQDPVKYEVTASVEIDMLIETQLIEKSFIGDVDDTLAEVKAEAKRMLLADYRVSN